MFYQFDDEITTVEFDSVSSCSVTAGYITVSELEAMWEKLGVAKSTVLQCREENRYFRSNIEVYDDYTFASLKIIDSSNMKSCEDCIALYVKKNIVIVVDVYDKDFSTRDRFFDALRRFGCQYITVERLIYAFMDSFICGDSKVMEDIELDINRMEEYVIRDKAGSDFNMELLHKKRELLKLHNYYEQLIDIGGALGENENELFDKEDLRYFKIFTDKANRLLQNINMLRDSVVHLRDAYQAYLDLKLNQTMKIFTLVSTIFLPLTVIVGWYGMNFRTMPEFYWQYGYLFVIILSVSVIGILVGIFKKKRWM